MGFGIFVDLEQGRRTSVHFGRGGKTGARLDTAFDTSLFAVDPCAGPAFVSQLSLLIPVWAVFLGVLFLDESPQPNPFYAPLLVPGGILVTQFARRK